MMGRMADADPYELLLGRGTYEIFAAHWPYSEGPIADRLNSARKHVASTTLERLDWSNSTLIDGDVAAYVTDLKETPGPEVQVHGSPGLIQTLLRHDLVDEYRMWIFPLVLGDGEAVLRRRNPPGRPAADRQRDHGHRRHDQHVRASGRHRGRLVRIRRAHGGRAGAAPAPMILTPRRQGDDAAAPGRDTGGVAGRP